MKNNIKKLKRAFATQAAQAEAGAFKNLCKKIAEEEQFRREHPVSSGAIPVAEYVAPRGAYWTPAMLA